MTEADSYKLVLLGLYYFNTDNITKAQEILNTLISRQKSTGEIGGATTSITRSRGESLLVETTALTMILQLRVNAFNNFFALEKMIEFLTSKMKNGFFASTQGTILSLLAFREYFDKFAQKSEKVNFDVSINGQQIRSISFDSNDLLSEKNCFDFSEDFKKFENPGQKIDVNVKASPN